jgi:hypothetical protein
MNRRTDGVKHLWRYTRRAGGPRSLISVFSLGGRGSPAQYRPTRTRRRSIASIPTRKRGPHNNKAISGNQLRSDIEWPEAVALVAGIFPPPLRSPVLLGDHARHLARHIAVGHATTTRQRRLAAQRSLLVTRTPERWVFMDESDTRKKAAATRARFTAWLTT